MPTTQPPLDVLYENVGRAETMLKLLANRHRLLVLCHLLKDARTVTELVDIIGLSQSALSQHLAKLRENGLVETEKQGQNVYYRIGDPKAAAILSTLYLIYC